MQFRYYYPLILHSGFNIYEQLFGICKVLDHIKCIHADHGNITEYSPNSAWLHLM